tara:strand:+ start:650 stop:838 length:189 start_codon:yes stop_codon:yes gene_type:complete
MKKYAFFFLQLMLDSLLNLALWMSLEMDYAVNFISKIQNHDIEVIKNKFLNENKILPKQTFN